MFTVFKILNHEDKQFLCVEMEKDKFGFAVYNELTGNTLLRPVECNLENLERAIRVLKGIDSGDF
jgi:hypothetical protein